MIASRVSSRTVPSRTTAVLRSTNLRPNLNAWHSASAPVASTSYSTGISSLISPNRTSTTPRAASSTVQSPTPSTLGLGEDVQISKAATAIISYSINFARVSETFEVHSWMLLLGLLKQEDCRAAKILKDLGLDDLYGAWNEVRMALRHKHGERGMQGPHALILVSRRCP